MFMKKFIQENDNLKIAKYKIAILEKHLYLCGFIIIKKNTDSILRTCCVVSYNPSVFEIDLKEDIKKIENVIYRYKFDGGNDAGLANKLFLKLYSCEEKIVESIDKENFDFVIEQIISVFNIEEKNKIKTEYFIDVFKPNVGRGDEINYNTVDNVVNTLEQKKFFLKTKPVFDHKKGETVEKIRSKEILCEFVDNREISKSIMRILFAKNEKYLYAKVVDVKQRNKRYYEITCFITPMIYTSFIVDKTQRLVVKK
jgi:hypothetical protein